MAALSHVEAFHNQIQDLLITPTLSTPSLFSYARILAMVEEVAGHITDSPAPKTPAALALMNNCIVYHKFCSQAIRRLMKRDAALEHEVYDRNCARRQSSVVYGVNHNGEPTVNAFNELSLREFIEGENQERVNERHVRFANDE